MGEFYIELNLSIKHISFVSKTMLYLIYDTHVSNTELKILTILLSLLYKHVAVDFTR